MKSRGTLSLMLAGMLLAAGPAAADYKKGLAALNAKDYPLAVEMFQSEVLARPDWYFAYYGLGVSLGELGRHDEAVKALEQAAQLTDKPADRFRILDALGTISLRQGQYTEAESVFQQALGLGVRDPKLLGTTWTKTGDSQLLQSRYPESTASYARARAAGKGGEVAYKQGMASWLSDDLEGAMEGFRAGTRGGPEVKSLEGLASVAMTRARQTEDREAKQALYVEALEAAGGLVQRDGSNPEYHELRCSALLGLRRWADAFDCYEAFSKRVSSNCPAFIGKARALLASDSARKAVRALDEGVRACPSHGDVYLWLGIAHERVAFKLRSDNTRCVQEFQKAVAAYEKAWELAPTELHQRYRDRARRNLQRARENIQIDEYNLEAEVYNAQAREDNRKKQQMLDEATKYIEAAYGRDAAEAETTVKEDE